MIFPRDYIDKQKRYLKSEYITLNPDGSRNLVCEIFGKRIVAIA